MQAVILAGGLGTRLWPLTRSIPKPMVPVAGTPYLEHQLRLLKRQEITDIVLLVGYLGEQIEQHFGDGHKLGLNISYGWERSPLGTGGALRQARHLLRDTFLLLYGDSFLPVRYCEPLELLLASSAEAVVVVYDDRERGTGVAHNIAIGSGGVVARYAKDARRDSSLQYVDAGVLAVRKMLLNQIPRQGPSSLEKEVYPRLIERGTLHAQVTRQRFYDIGTPERLEAIERYLCHDYHPYSLSR